MRRRVALSLVVHGWQGARQCSLALDGRGVLVVHLLKGRLAAEVLALIAPRPWIRHVAVPRAAFRVVAWAAIAWYTATGQLGWLLVDNDRTYGEVAAWCRRFGVRGVRVHQVPDMYGERLGPLPGPRHLAGEDRPARRLCDYDLLVDGRPQAVDAVFA